jgi:hypothetical protein
MTAWCGTYNLPLHPPIPRDLNSALDKSAPLRARHGELSFLTGVISSDNLISIRLVV